jgi:ssDNA-binding replication factor A large subunit
MPELDRLFGEILKQKPDLDEGKLRGLIDEKKKKVGAGYLTDSGAAFLVASDLDVSLEIVAAREIGLKDLYIGANEVTVTGRILTIGPARQYHRKDGSEGQYRRFTIYDKEAFVTVTLWDDKTTLIEDIGILPGSVVRIQKGYIKSGLDGRPIIHLGNRGGLEIIEEETMTYQLPSIKDLTQDVASINTPETNLVITGVMKSLPRVSEFTRKDGQPGKVLQMYLNSLSGNRSIRVAIWDNDSISETGTPVNAVVRLVGVKSRFSQDSSIEIHGNESTSLQVISVQKSYGESGSSIFRLLSIGKLRTKADGDTSVSLLAVNESGSFFTLVLKDGAAETISDLKRDQLVECDFREISPLTLLCTDRSSIRLTDTDDDSYPRLASIASKIKDIGESQSPLTVEVIALSRTSNQDILTKAGENVTKSEVIVGDETRETTVVAWRDLIDLLDGIAPGQRLRLIGVAATRGFDGAPELQIKSYSQVEKIS